MKSRAGGDQNPECTQKVETKAFMLVCSAKPQNRMRPMIRIVPLAFSGPGFVNEIGGWKGEGLKPGLLMMCGNARVTCCLTLPPPLPPEQN
jgi:hypothetical protein